MKRIPAYAKLISMKIEEQIISSYELQYPLDSIAPLDQILFIDIETTGFLSSSSSIYMIGTLSYKDNNWQLRQFFANQPEEEKQILEAFFEFAQEYSFLIHYNGNTFDLPFIANKAQKYGLDNVLSTMTGLDIYRRITPYKNLLKLPDCKLKSVEEFLGISREDEYSGGELIEVYKEYTSLHDYDLLQKLLLHNSDDMKGMLDILPILSYFDLFNNELKATKVSANYYQDINGIPKSELLIGLSFEHTLPVEISFMGCGCYFKAEGNSATLLVPIFEEELKYFYANYMEYYYLPLEDTALHSSIATYVDKDFRQKAKPENCYTRKISKYLPQWDTLVNPFFKREYKSKELFFELTDEIKQNRKLFSDYSKHVINHIAFQKQP